jgi:hypothetical protein
MDGDAAHLPFDPLALPGVEAGAYLDSEIAPGVHDRPRTADRACRPVECGEEAVPRLVGDVQIAAPCIGDPGIRHDP